MLSDDEDDDNDIENNHGRRGISKQVGDEFEDDDGDARHLRMLHGITGMPSEFFEGITLVKLSSVDKFSVQIFEIQIVKNSVAWILVQ